MLFALWLRPPRFRRLQSLGQCIGDRRVADRPEMIVHTIVVPAGDKVRRFQDDKFTRNVVQTMRGLHRPQRSIITMQSKLGPRRWPYFNDRK
jgi:hypothetical protein